MSYPRTNLSQALTWLTHSLIMCWDRSAFGSAALQPINQDHGAVAEDSGIIYTESPQRRVPLDLVATVTPSPLGRRPFEGPSRSLSNHPVETGCATFSFPKKSHPASVCCGIIGCFVCSVAGNMSTAELPTDVTFHKEIWKDLRGGDMEAQSFKRYLLD